MADYYPLLAKAVAAQAQSDPDKRRAIYERARKALLAQLRAIQPPIPEPDIERESQALDDAANRLESELAPQDAVAAPARPTSDLGAPASAAAQEPPRTRMPLKPLPLRPLPPRPPLRSRLGKPPQPEPDAPPEAQPLAPPEEAAAPPSEPAEARAPPPDSSQDTWQDASAAPAGAGSGFTLPQNRAEAEPPLRPRSDQFHPAAPRPEPAGRRNRGIWIAGAV